MPAPASRVEQSGTNHYIFTSTWVLPTNSRDVFMILSDVMSYVEWWPEFRSAVRTGPDTGDFVLRSFLPFSLRFTLRREIEDADRGHLRAVADGDIEGSVEWTLSSSRAHSTRADFRQDVILMHPIARRLSSILKPALRLNHAVAMRGGYEGIKKRLSL